MLSPHPQIIDANFVRCPPLPPHFELMEMFGIEKDSSVTIMRAKFRIQWRLTTPHYFRSCRSLFFWCVNLNRFYQVQSLSKVHILKVLSFELHLAISEILWIKYFLPLPYEQGRIDSETSAWRVLYCSSLWGTKLQKVL